MRTNDPIFVAGHRGMVGSAICRALEREGFTNVITATRKQCDLSRQDEAEAFFRNQKPKYVFVAAAKVGGILANDSYPAEFLYDNLMIAANTIHAAWKEGVEKLLFLGSTCIYPKHAEQPIREESLLSGPLEPTNQWYAVAKIAGAKLCEAYQLQYGARFISCMPTNLYGQNDNFDLKTSHVLPALIRKFHEAKVAGSPEVELWGTGKPLREFLHCDDLAEASLFLMRNYEGREVVNVGYGSDVTIEQLAGIIATAVGYEGGIRYDTSKPDGTPRKLADSSKLRALGWAPRISLEEGIRATYEWYLAHAA